MDELGEKKNLLTPKSQYPTAVYFILVGEFFEQFSFYIVKPSVLIYLIEWHRLEHHSAVALFHIFSMVMFVSTLLGGYLADGWLGKFRALIYVCILYAFGTLVLSLTSLPPHEIYGTLVGLLITGIGTGSIKPCVTALGGDQFSSDQVKERWSFFSAFYVFINLGSMIGIMVAPMLRANVHCINDSCYPLAFGTATLSMCLAIVIFVGGMKRYKKFPATGNLFTRVARCTVHGLKQRIRHGKRKEKDGHWLDYAVGRYDKPFIEDVKDLLKVLRLFLPLPVYWALFNQQPSSWTLQAEQMDGSFGLLGRVLPDQLQTLNPLIVLLFIPLFDKIIYPCLDKLHFLDRPLQRMALGMLFTGTAFLCAGILQMKLEPAKEKPVDGESGITFINTVNCSLDIQSDFYTQTLPAFMASPMIRIDAGNKTVQFHCNETENATSVYSPFLLENNQAYRIVVRSNFSTSLLSASQLPDHRRKDPDGRATLSIINNLPLPNILRVQLRNYESHKAEKEEAVNILLSEDGASDFTTVEPGNYQVFVPSQDSILSNQTWLAAVPVLTFGVGSVQTVVLQYKDDDGLLYDQITVQQYISRKENEISMAWMIPQYVLLTIGETLFAITGMAFAYSQSPASMKSVIQAAWQLCVAFGDLLVITVAESQVFPSQTSAFFMFAIVMGLDTVIFSILAYQYKSRPLLADTETDIHVETNFQSNGVLYIGNGIPHVGNGVPLIGNGVPHPEYEIPHVGSDILPVDTNINHVGNGINHLSNGVIANK